MRVTTFTYDIMNRQTDVVETYDDLQGGGPLTTGSFTNAYNLLGQNTSQTRNLDGLTVSYQYDGNGNRETVSWPDGYQVIYNHDALGRVTTVDEYVDGVNNITLATYAFDALSRRTSLTYQNGASVSYTYEVDNDLADISHAFTSGAGADNVAMAFAYNSVSQLISENYTNAAFLWTDLSDTSTTYTVNNLNQYTAVGGVTFAYDLNGNLTSDGGNTYAYDSENRLIHASMDDAGHHWNGDVDFVYDPFGRLEERIVTPAGGGGASYATSFLLDGEYQIAEYAKDQGTGALTLERRYVYGPGVDEPIVMVDYTDPGGTGDAEVYTFYHQDRRGSVVALSGESGARTDVYTYSAYGVPDDWTGNRIRFIGRWLDFETGLYYYRARFYSSTLGRFMQTDPIGYGDNMNMYAYVGGDPMNAGDPSGAVCVPLVNSDSSFCRRAELYGELDADDQIAQQTTFFGAAAMITELIAGKDLPFGDRFVSEKTDRFLEDVSAELEVANLDQANLMRTYVFDGGTRRENDRQMVRMEQGIVQTALDSFRSSDQEGFNTAIDEVNALLNGNSEGVVDGALTGTASFFDGNTRAALQSVRDSLGRDIDFAIESDRIAIGDALTDQLRSVDCTPSTGSRIRSC